LYLTWDAIDEDDVVSTKLYRSGDGSPYELLATFDSDVGEYTDADVSPGMVYSYKLTCVDLAGQEGDFSQEVSEIGGRPPAPAGLVAESGDGEVTLSWVRVEVPDIDNINVYRRLNYAENFDHLAALAPGDTTYHDADVINGNSYFYYLTSVSIYGVESYPSDTAYAFPQGPGQRSGILIVNGINGNAYDDEVREMYQQRALTGDFDYHFWDLHAAPPFGGWPYPETIIGEGDLDPILFNAYETVIWAGNAFQGDLEQWQAQQTNIMNYLNSGGNLMLPCRYGSSFLFAELSEYARVQSFRNSVRLYRLVSQVDPLTDISTSANQTLNDLVTVDSTYTQIIYRDSTFTDWVAGFVVDPEPANAGIFVYIAGRPYRWNLDELRVNCQTILEYYLGMTPTGIEDPEIILPDEYILYQNYPNPFNPATTIRFGLPARSDIRLEIFDILGRQVAILADEPMEAGYHEIIWNSRNRSGGEVSTGVYFYRLKAGEFNSIKKMLILK